MVELNSNEVITWLNECIEHGLWELFPILSKEGKVFSSCDWVWVPRSANGAANYVASHAGAEMCDFVWVRRSSSLFVRILNKDGLPCPPH